MKNLLFGETDQHIIKAFFTNQFNICRIIFEEDETEITVKILSRAIDFIMLYA